MEPDRAEWMVLCFVMFWCGHCGAERAFFIYNLLVRIHFIIVMIRRTSLAPREFEDPFPGSLTSTFLKLRCTVCCTVGVTARCIALQYADMLTLWCFVVDNVLNERERKGGIERERDIDNVWCNSSW